MIAHCGTKFGRYRTFVFNRQIGNAPARIQLVGRGKRLGGANIQTGLTAAAMVGFRLIDRQHGSGENTARNSHEPKSRDTRLVCLPCQPSPAAAASGFSMTVPYQQKLSHRALIGDHPSRDVFEFFLDDIVIIAALCVNRNHAFVTRVQIGQRVFGRRIIHAEHNHRLTCDHNSAGCARRSDRAPSSPCHHDSHCPEKRADVRGFGYRVRMRDAANIKTLIACGLFQRPNKRSALSSGLACIIRPKIEIDIIGRWAHARDRIGQKRAETGSRFNARIPVAHDRP